MNEKVPSVEIQLPNFVKDLYSLAKSRLTALGYDKWLLLDALDIKSFGKCNPGVNKYFHRYCCQINCALFFVATSAFGIP